MSNGLRIALGSMFVASLPFSPLRTAGASDPDLDLARRLNSAFVTVAETASPAVVIIRVEGKAPLDAAANHRGLLEFLPEDVRKELLERLEKGEKGESDDKEGRGRRRPAPLEIEQGSGVIFREDGYILTNGHVVENASKIDVRLQDGRRFPAVVTGMDPESDLAILKVEGTGLPAARLGDSSKVRVGEFAIAIGAPFDLEYSVTFGHVSAKGRRVFTDFVMADQDFIQTDASINPGNSGGPLVNIEGEVIGINSMIHGMNTGIGFAVPINLAKEVATRLIETGHFTRAWLGVFIRSLSDNPDAKPADVPVSQGVLVTGIQKDGPSWGSELAAQDVIVAVEGEPVRTDLDLKRQISRRAVGKPVQVEVFRGSKKLQLMLTPGELPSDRLVALWRNRPAPAPAPESATGLGLTIGELESGDAERLGLERGEGVMVVAVKENSPADARHIVPGEVITKINRRPVRNLKEFHAAIEDADLKRGVSMAVVGENGRRYVVLKHADNDR